jgi:hypothetical protein
MTTAETDAFVSHYFGVCPECHRTDGYINVGRGHWFYCQQHHTRWCVGSNLFDSWKFETEDEQRDIYDRVGFSRFQDVEPFYPDET